MNNPIENFPGYFINQETCEIIKPNNKSLTYFFDGKTVKCNFPSNGGKAGRLLSIVKIYKEASGIKFTGTISNCKPSHGFDYSSMNDLFGYNVFINVNFIDGKFNRYDLVDIVVPNIPPYSSTYMADGTVVFSSHHTDRMRELSLALPALKKKYNLL